MHSNVGTFFYICHVKLILSSSLILIVGITFAVVNEWFSLIFIYLLGFIDTKIYNNCTNMQL